MLAPTPLAPEIGVMLCGHGSRSQSAVTEFATLAEALKTRFAGSPVAYGYLEFANPVIRDGLDALRAAGARRILAVPGMLFAASHAKNDIPSVLNTYAATHGIAIDYGRELGIDARMLRAAGDRVRAAVAELDAAHGPAPASDTCLVVVGRGASDPDANANVAKMARLLWEGFGFGWCETAYSGVTFPAVAPCLENVAKLGFKRVVVFPYFLFSGILIDRIYGFTDDVAARHPEIRFAKAPYLGDHPAVIDTFAERVTEILEGQAVMNCGLCKYRTQVLGFESEVGAPQESHHHHVEGMGASAPGSSVETCDLCTTFCTGACRVLRPAHGHGDAHHHHHDADRAHDHGHAHGGEGHGHHHGSAHDHSHGHDHEHGHGPDHHHRHDHEHGHGPDHGHGHGQGHSHGHEGAHGHVHSHSGDDHHREHRHGGDHHGHHGGHDHGHHHHSYPHEGHPLGPVSVLTSRKLIYERDPKRITEKSFAVIRAEADLGRFGAAAPLAERVVHAAGDTGILPDLVVHNDVMGAVTRALEAGASVVVDSEMTRHAISARFLNPARVLCHLNDADTPALAEAAGTTRSAIAIEKAALDGAVVVIGNAPTALFALLERIREGARPAAILAFPVGFIGAAESKEALIALKPDAPYATLRGRRGGSAMAGAALNAIAATAPALTR